MRHARALHERHDWAIAVENSHFIGQQIGNESLP
jgi:hypothetical protein